MKKIVGLFLCLNILSLNFAFALNFEDSLVEHLDKNLKVEKIRYKSIEDELAKKLDKNIKIKKSSKIYYYDDFVNNTLDSNLKIKILKQEQVVDSLLDKIDRTKFTNQNRKIANLGFSGGKIKVSPAKYYTTRKKLQEGIIIDFVLLEDVKILDKIYKKGELVKARVETLSMNAARGVPADLVVGNFTLPDNLVLNGQIEKQGANRALWVYPTGYLLTFFFFVGLPVFAIRGGHVKLKPSRIYEVEI